MLLPTQNQATAWFELSSVGLVLSSRSQGWRHFAVARRMRAAFRRNWALCAFLIMTLDVFRMYVKIEKVEKIETNVLVVKGE
ncbi:hypothetical protein B7H16_08310 [Anoxybacillus ayderensis]|nr:hypothetical protein B7H16_08310 [Anoxybacillus ayderensis]